jgi:hypothetical protein
VILAQLEAFVALRQLEATARSSFCRLPVSRQRSNRSLCSSNIVAHSQALSRNATTYAE